MIIQIYSEEGSSYITLGTEIARRTDYRINYSRKCPLFMLSITPLPALLILYLIAVHTTLSSL